MTENLASKIPKIDTVLKNEEWKRISAKYPSGVLRSALNDVLDSIRANVKNGTLLSIPSLDEIISETEKKANEIMSPNLKKVINATGIIVHTNLGRSILPKKALEALMEASSHYTNLEYDLAEGKRGDRYIHCSKIIKKLSGAEDALVVNNNAAAVYLVLNTLAEGKEVIVSRGELVEIGGSFRVPDVMRKSGAIIKEVGTTNKTYLKDYEEAITEKTALLMKVHKSNFVIKGFSHEVKSEELVTLGNKYGIPVYYDAGSGLFFMDPTLSSTEPYIPAESKKGVDLISFSGDKLLGGPQAGIIVGKKCYIEPMKRNPLLRALRPDKLTLAALEATLLLYLDEKKAKDDIPTLKMMNMDLEYLKRKAKRIIKAIKKGCEVADVALESTCSQVGGGSLPESTIPSYGFSIRPKKLSVNTFEKILRGLKFPIIARIEKERILFDVRTILEDEEKILVDELVMVLKEHDLYG